MLLIFLIIQIPLLFMSYKYWGKIINPISIYSVVWIIAISIYQSGLVAFYELRSSTFLLIVVVQIVYSLGCIFGFRIKSKNDIIIQPLHIDDQKKKLERYLILCLILSGISILIKFYSVYQTYGFHLLINTTNIYSDRFSGNSSVIDIPYLGAFIDVALPLMGIHTRKFGFSKYTVITIALVVISSLSGGARGGLVFALLLFVFSFIITKPSPDGSFKKMNIKVKIGLIIGCIAIGIVFYLISYSRTLQNPITYATDTYKRIFGNSSLVYKIFVYIGAPVGVLNEFLKDPVFSFGGNTFLPIYNILARLGFMERTAQYQTFYYTPVSCNVGTWIREFVEDFDVVGCIIAVFIVAAFTGYFFKKILRRNSYSDIVVCSILLMIISMSFFDLRFRSSSIWIAIGFGYYFGHKIDKAGTPTKDYSNNQIGGQSRAKG